MEESRIYMQINDEKDIILNFRTITTNCGSLQASLNYDNLHKLRNNMYYGSKILTISSIYVDKVQRGKGIGSILIKEIIKYAKSNNIKKIILDDMTDNYRQSHNIYIKHGFCYVDDYGPEMELFIN